MARSWLANPACNGALANLTLPNSTQPVPNVGSLGLLLNLVNPNQNTFSGIGSNYPTGNGNQTVGQYFQANADSAAALVVMNGQSTANNVLFLGAAFFNPTMAGVLTSTSAVWADALILLHEAVHLAGDPDIDFGPNQAQGSANLTQDILNACAPGLAGRMGSLQF